MSSIGNDKENSLGDKISEHDSDYRKDAVHKPVDRGYPMAPGQLYPTEAGTLFHVGSIFITLVGLPVKSKTLLAVSMTRYIRCLDVRTKLFPYFIIQKA